ncbi:MAG TPA: PQQ-binding-like beta-propeller repeat protein [Pirellulales bacterium]|nr:PQQ-binding-like beta-propeller repeat protein [Pirellulales bacterium]
MRTSLFVAAALLASCVATMASAENWPCWRGPRGDGTSRETNVPIRWSATENVLWKVEVPGMGHASPIVWGDRVFTVSCLTENGDRVLVCFDRSTGKLRWQQTIISTPLEKKHTLNSFASSTPATDGKQVFVSFLENHSDDPAENRGLMVVASYDFAGKQQWLVKPGVFSSTHGYCSCPVLFEDLVIINGDHDGDSYIVALRRDTGETAWKVEREHRTRSYVTPIIRTIDGQPELILSGSKSVCAYNPRTGQRIWNIDGPTEQFVASMVDDGELVFLTAGFPARHILAIRPDGHGNVTDTHIVWRTTENCSYVPSPVITSKYFLVVADNGIASCFEAKTGKRQWKERLEPHYSASLVTAGGLTYFLADDGVMTVVRPGAKFDEVAKNDLGEHCFASPAISDGQVFIRAEKHLFCIGKRATESN